MTKEFNKFIKEYKIKKELKELIDEEDVKILILFYIKLAFFIGSKAGTKEINNVLNSLHFF